jgi:tyrosine-protein phosphatase SIW14
MKTSTPAALLALPLLLTVLATCCTADPLDPSVPRPAAWAKPVGNDAVPNWYRIDDRLQRSGQPDDDGFAALREAGVRSVLNLRQHHDDDDEAEGTGVTLYHVPTDAGSLTEAEIEEAMGILATADAPILVHCWHGSDRTGAICAAYRIVFQDWEVEAAIEELQKGGYGYHTMYDNLLATLRSIDWAAMKERVGKASGIRPN